MKRLSLKLVLQAIGLCAGLVALVCMTLLTVSYIQAFRQAPRDELQLKHLEQKAKDDASQNSVLVAERDRQKDVSLRRESHTQKCARILLAAAILFLCSAKWGWSTGHRDAQVISKEALDRYAGRGSTGGQKAGVEAAGAGSVGPAADPPIDLVPMRDIIARAGTGRESSIPVLQAIQSHYGYLPDAALQHACAHSDIAPAQIAGVASFYSHFRRTPAGKHIVRVCHGTACHVAGAEIIHDEIRKHLNIPEGTDTDAERQFTVEKVACMGCCTLAPVAQVDGATRGHLTADQVAGIIDESAATISGEDLSSTSSRGRDHHGVNGRGEIRVGVGSCCVAGGSGKVYQALEEAIAATGAPVTVKRVGCVGMCHRTPLVEAVLPAGSGSFYAIVRPEEAAAIVRRHFRPRGASRRLASAVRSTLATLKKNSTARPMSEVSFSPADPPAAAFLDRQVHIATEHCGEIDPTDFDEYVRRGGFEALRTCVLSLAPGDVIERIQASGLRGRGGAGFATSLKWTRVRQAQGELKYVICNGDEGDPGAFMDRMLMESFPFRIIEGMAIAARAVGGTEGYFYIREEYPLAVRRIRDALRECERRGLLGPRILGTDFALTIRVMEGAGAFVCGEETALIASIEGDRGTPRLRPPFPAEKGLWNRPTLINNVETLAMVPWIIRHGAEAFSALGTPTSKGTKVFALAGKIKRGGLIEVPMGITVRAIVKEIGGGTKSGLPFKAVQIGGPSGGCIPAEQADLPVDYEALGSAGAIMGSGGLVVLDDSDCMVDIARYFVAFTQDQSCGKCTFCRVGTRRMLDILDRICAGRGRPGDLEALEELAMAVKNGSLCGLGKTAPNPVLTTLRYFRAEYEAHLAGHCPARKCKALIRYRVLDNCTGCTLCAQNCGEDAIAFAPYQKHRIDDAKCTRCGICVIKCPEHAIVVESPCPA